MQKEFEIIKTIENWVEIVKIVYIENKKNKPTKKD